MPCRILSSFGRCLQTLKRRRRPLRPPHAYPGARRSPFGRRWPTLEKVYHTRKFSRRLPTLKQGCPPSVPHQPGQEQGCPPPPLGRRQPEGIVVHQAGRNNGPKCGPKRSPKPSLGASLGASFCSNLPVLKAARLTILYNCFQCFLGWKCSVPFL